MRKKGRIKYFLVILLCFFILISGFMIININKPDVVRKKSKFTMDLILKPFDFRIDTKDYVFYINSKVITNIKEGCIDTYEEIFSK